jgi:hypothetical protein
MTKSKIKEDNEPMQSTETKKAKQPIIDFMPGWAKEEKCYKDAIVRDYNTKEIVEGGWLRPHNTSQWAYENWLSQVVNQETGQFFQQRDEEGIPVPNTGARHVVSLITRVRDQSGKNEHLLSKGRLIGYNSAGQQKTTPISYPEKWNRTTFQNERTYNENTGAFTVQTIGPSKSEDVYELPFTADNVQKLYEQVEQHDCQFVLKDIKTGEARSVSWSSVKDTLNLFCHKSWEHLWKAEYIPLPVRMEARQEAVAKGLIKGCRQ